MPLKNNTLLRRVTNLDLKLQSSTDITLVFDGVSIQGNQDSLAILDAFSASKTLGEGLELLKPRFTGIQSYLDIVSQIGELYELGVLVDPSQQTPILGSHTERFDASPVHIRMLHDHRRTLSYQQAIRETVTSSDIVVDIGTGTGVLAATAAMAGAKHVYAVEKTSISTLAQQIFDENGLSDRITLIEGDSTRIELPEKADVMISEIIGNDPLDEGVVQITTDAKRRLLKPNARLIPDSLEVFGLPVSVPTQELDKQVFTQETTEYFQRLYGIDFSPLARASEKQNHYMLINTYRARNWPHLSEPILLLECNLEELDYSSIQTSNQVLVNESGVLSGILIYFELHLGKTVQFSIHPQQATPENNWASKVWIPGTRLSFRAGDVFGLNYRHTNSGSVFEIQRIPSSSK